MLLSLFQNIKKHLYVYAFPAYIETNICLINCDVKNSDEVYKVYTTEEYGLLLYVLRKDGNVNECRKYLLKPEISQPAFPE